MRSSWTLLCVVFFSLISLAVSLSSSGTRLLVVLEDSSRKDAYSTFWADLTARGYILDFQFPKSSQLSLFRLSERSYDHVLLLPPTSKSYGNALSPQLLLDFLKANGNILLALSGQSPVPTQVVSLLLELDIHLPPDRTSIVVDHFTFDSAFAPEEHDILLLPAPKAIRNDVKNYFQGEFPLVVPRAVGQVLGQESPLLAPILRAPKTAYSFTPTEEGESADDPFATGSQLAIVSALQARNSARLTVLGSVEMLENKWFDASAKLNGKSTKVGNQLFAKQLTAWTFQESGVLKVGRLHHHLKAPSSLLLLGENVPLNDINPDIYRIKNDVTFAIELSEYDSNQLIPYTPATADAIQLEVTMLSPFYRLSLEMLGKTPNSTIFGTSLTFPDQHGIFNLRVNYKRPFLTSIDEKRQVTLRHFAHDEYPRSYVISGAWTWIAGIGVTITAWIVFVALWLWSAPTPSAGIVKKSQ